MKVLVLNSGSSSIKYEVFDMRAFTSMASGILDDIGARGGRLVHRVLSASGDVEEVTEPAEVADHHRGLERVVSVLRHSGTIAGPDDLLAIAHRVVHGGERFGVSALVDDAVVEAIRESIPLAPLHNPANLMGIEVARRLYPRVPQVAVFDTGFHRTLPAHAYRYAIPAELYARHGVRRYGFHGTSHHYVARRAAQLLGRPLASLDLVTLHLGNGASATAIHHGRSVDTSMGMTPLEGLVMGTRCGDIDPGAVLHLVRDASMRVDDVDAALRLHGGLEGLCGDGDMREVLRRVAGGDAEAALALDVYCYRVKKYVGAYLAVLGRADALVFTAGVGENSPVVRARCCEGLAGLGIALDRARNEAGATGEREIQAEGSSVKVLVIPTDEELEIAHQAVACVRGGDAP